MAVLASLPKAAEECSMCIAVLLAHVGAEVEWKIGRGDLMMSRDAREQVSPKPA